ncbi:response regulator [Epibacterium sp. DP7N7-1]|nr:response regulator [Epibacterium sp. DP7N7-1]
MFGLPHFFDARSADVIDVLFMTQAAKLTPDPYDVQLRELGLVKHEREADIDNLTTLAARLLNVPTALVSVVQRSLDRQFFKSCIGLPELSSELRQTPLSHSFCQFVQDTNQPLVVTDSRKDAQLRDNAAVIDLGMVAYLGVPIHLPDGKPIGALCVIDRVPRQWSHDDLKTMQQLGCALDDLIALKRARDVAADAETRAQQDAEARKTHLAHMSHEIRTPLNGIIGSVDLLMRGASSLNADLREQNDLLRSINRSAQSLQRLLNDALDIAKIDAGKLELAPAAFDLREVVNDAVKLFSAQASQKGVDLTHSFREIDAKEWRYGDQFRLSQILGNLLSNAIKFTDQGTVGLHLHGTPDALHLTLRDSGCGIAPERLDKLFLPFTQASAHVAHEKGGTGLGLTIVHQMVELMQGRIRAESTPGEGTIFHLYLPLPVTDAEIEPVIEEFNFDVPTRRAEDLPLLGKRVLVADDSPANRLVLQKMLENLGASVDKAYDGSDAFGRAVTTRYDVLLLDIQMPGHKGTEVVRKLRAHPRHLAHSALCIAVTGNTYGDQVEEYLDAGFDAWLGKPLRQPDLLRVLSPLIPDLETDA